MHRFKFIKVVSFDYPEDGYTQELFIFWDNNLNCPIGLDLSFIEQNDSFQHPYNNEIIVFDRYPSAF